jgi:hypothetical protein
MALSALVVFFILGWSYYMVATILMEGSVFASMRMYVARHAETNRFFDLLRDMLGCLMCTATEAALWTVGVVSFALGFHYRLVSRAIGLMAGRQVALPISAELLLALAVAFALSLAIAGEAWGIKNVMENRDEKFLKLRSEFRAREAELLRRIAELEDQTMSGDGIEIDLS